MASELTKTPGGDLVIPADKLGRLKDIQPEGLRLTTLSDDLLVTGYAQPGERARPLFYGDLRLFHVGELMALISSMRKDGSLCIDIPMARKAVYFAGGEIVYATSTVEDDRLGEILWRRGFLSLKQLSEVHDLVTPKKKLGAVLVEKGLLTPRQLYDGIKDQVTEIVYSTFHMRQGEFVFVEGKVRQRGAVRLDMDTRKVIMEGIRRVEEMTRLEELFPDRQVVLVKRPMVVDAELGEAEERLYRLINAERTVQEIIERSHLRDFEALKALAKLRRIGVIGVIEPDLDQRLEEGPTPGVLDQYSKILRFIHQTLKAEAPGSETRLEAYLGSPNPVFREVFLNVGFDQDGNLDMDSLYRNAREIRSEDPRKLSLEALRSLYDYSLFQAMDVLEDDTCDGMMDRLQAMRSKLDLPDKEASE